MAHEYAGYFEGPSAAKLESGLWLRYRRQRDANLPPGILQGLPAEVFTKMISSDGSSYEVDLNGSEILDPFDAQLNHFEPQYSGDTDLNR